MRSTPSSPDGPRRPSRAALAALIAVSIAVPAAGLGVVLTSDSDSDAGSTDDNATASPIACEVFADDPGGTVGEGDAAPDFRLRALDGGCHRLSDFRGTPVVLTFFASWCHPCEQEMPLLEDASNEHGDDMQVLAVSYNDLRMDSEAFVERLEVTYPAFHDDKNTVAGAYNVRAIPQTFFIGADGIVQRRVFGITSERALDEPLGELLTP